MPDSKGLRPLTPEELTSIDAMRMARAEDHRTCARLTRRVEELEAEVAQAQSDLDAHRWAIHDSGILDGDNVSLKRLIVEALLRKGYKFRSGYTGLADGTREEKAGWCCEYCRVPMAAPTEDAYGRCERCAYDSKVPGL